jgi:hypothetical protein
MQVAPVVSKKYPDWQDAHTFGEEQAKQKGLVHRRHLSPDVATERPPPQLEQKLLEEHIKQLSMLQFTQRL